MRTTSSRFSCPGSARFRNARPRPAIASRNCASIVITGFNPARALWVTYPIAFAADICARALRRVRQVMAGKVDGTRHDLRAASRQGADQAAADHRLPGSRIRQPVPGSRRGRSRNRPCRRHGAASRLPCTDADPQIADIERAWASDCGERRLTSGDPLLATVQALGEKGRAIPAQHNARPGKIVIHQASRTKGRPSLIMTPHSAVGGDGAERQERQAGDTA